MGLNIQQHREQAKTEDELDERKARRAYKYEAKKRLYEELYPILFQITEASESAASRIVNLAKRYNDEDDRDEFLKALKQDGDNYYLKSTIYRIFLPLALYRIMQRRLTHVDLSQDNQLHGVYNLLKALFRTFGDDREIGKAAGLTYERSMPEGFLRGDLDCIVESLIFSDNQNQPRCLTYYEFDTHWSALEGNLSKAVQFLKSFTPDDRPVLWIAFKAQVLLHRAIIKAAEEPDTSPAVVDFDAKEADILSCTKIDKSHDLTYKYLQESKVNKYCKLSRTVSTAT